MANLRLFAQMAVGFFICFFCYLYVANEHQIYIWDWGGYYKKYLEFGDYLVSGNKFAHFFWNSIRTDDYNASDIIPLLPLYASFGMSRSVYVMGIFVIYFIPACLVMINMTETAIGGRAQLPVGLGAFTFLAAFLSWPLWIPAIRGMPDVIGLIPLGIATHIVLKTNYLSEANRKTGIAVGVLLWLAFLLRRWYAYSCVVLIAMSVFFCVIKILRKGRSIRSELVSAGIIFAILGLTILICLWVFQAPFAHRILKTSYAEINASYQYPFWAQVSSVNFGPVFVWLAVFGSIAAIAGRKPDVLFLAFLSIFTFLFFSRVQAPGVQHLMPFYFWLFPVFVFGIMTVANIIK